MCLGKRGTLYYHTLTFNFTINTVNVDERVNTDIVIDQIAIFNRARPEDINAIRVEKAIQLFNAIGLGSEL